MECLLGKRVEIRIEWVVGVMELIKEFVVVVVDGFLVFSNNCIWWVIFLMLMFLCLIFLFFLL